jgi:hypothetical protein
LTLDGERDLQTVSRADTFKVWKSTSDFWRRSEYRVVIIFFFSISYKHNNKTGSGSTFKLTTQEKHCTPTELQSLLQKLLLDEHKSCVLLRAFKIHLFHRWRRSSAHSRSKRPHPTRECEQVDKMNAPAFHRPTLLRAAD